ncbi:tail fiber domain-containing protein [Janthinobacterium sp. RB2R34]|uniref:tail fiber domain-containing protein n=1 Tax=Janthinobacterium sp. RB2R34 TaxID=3424193 RepID=UPI003F28750F
MASKFYAGMKNVVEALNEMWAAFAAGPYNALPLTGGALTGTLTAPSLTVYALQGTFAGTSSSGGWYKLGRLSAQISAAGRIVINGLHGYSASGVAASTAGVTTIHLRKENDGVTRGFYYSESSDFPAVLGAIIDSAGDIYVLLGAFFSGDAEVFGQFSFAPAFALYGSVAPAGQVLLSKHITFLNEVPVLALDRNNATFVATLWTQAVRPSLDNAYDIGLASVAYRTIYARTGTINTSDVRFKCRFRNLIAAEIAAARDLARAIGIYRWRDAVEEKGEGAREHIGPTVQAAIEIMQRHGLDPFNYGFICYDAWERQTVEHPAIEARPAVPVSAEVPAVLNDDGSVLVPAVPAQPGYPAVEARAAYTEVVLEAGDRYAFRYDELAMFIAAGQEARLAALEAA